MGGKVDNSNGVGEDGGGPGDSGVAAVAIVMADASVGDGLLACLDSPNV